MADSDFRTIPVCVVGAGYWGRNHVRTFDRLPGAELAYVCDRDPDVRQRMGALYPQAKMVTELSEALADDHVEAVVVAVDVPAHHAVAAEALEAGRHVFVEKPLTTSAAEAEDLCTLAARRKRTLMVGHLMVHHPAVRYMKRMIEKGEVGDPLYFYSHRLNLGIVREEENSWWSLAPHDISVACHLFDAEPIEVTATGQDCLHRGIEDVVFATLRFPAGRLAHVHVSWLDPHKVRRATLVGSDRMVVFDDMSATEKIRIYDKGATVDEQAAAGRGAVALRSGDVLIPAIRDEEPLMLECRHFLECVRTGRTPLTDGADGLRVVRALEAGARTLASQSEPQEP